MENVAVEAGSVSRNSVLRNTYALLSLTMIWSTIMAAVGTVLNIGMGVYLVLVLLGFGTLFATRAFRNSAMGVVMVFAFTGIEGLSLGPILQMYLHMANGAQIIGTAAGLTGVMFLSLSGYALISRKDFSFMGGFLVAGLIALILVSLIGMFFSFPGMYLALAFVSALIFSGFILFDTSRIVNGGETNYIMATVELYLDILNLFLALLRIISAFTGNRK
jgi:modulator of FtsH protease